MTRSMPDSPTTPYYERLATARAHHQTAMHLAGQTISPHDEEGLPGTRFDPERTQNILMLAQIYQQAALIEIGLAQMSARGMDPA